MSLPFSTHNHVFLVFVVLTRRQNVDTFKLFITSKPWSKQSCRHRRSRYETWRSTTRHHLTEASDNSTEAALSSERTTLSATTTLTRFYDVINDDDYNTHVNITYTTCFLDQSVSAHESRHRIGIVFHVVHRTRRNHVSRDRRNQTCVRTVYSLMQQRTSQLTIATTEWSCNIGDVSDHSPSTDTACHAHASMRMRGGCYRMRQPGAMQAVLQCSGLVLLTLLFRRPASDVSHVVKTNLFTYPN